MKNMATEFGGLFDSFKRNELDFFAQQLIEAVVVGMPDRPTNSNQTVADLCRSLMGTVDMNEAVLRIINARLNTK